MEKRFSGDFVAGYLGGPNSAYWEIFVARSDNLHAFKSRGWDGPEKIIISANPPNNRIAIDEELFENLLWCAEDYAKRRNAESEKPSGPPDER